MKLVTVSKPSVNVPVTVTSDLHTVVDSEGEVDGSCDVLDDVASTSGDSIVGRPFTTALTAYQLVEAGSTFVTT